MSRLTAKIIDNGPLTDKEAQVLRYMCEGLHSTKIAGRLCRSPRTIGKHIENIGYKLDAHGSSQIVLIAREQGLVKITINNSTNHVLKFILLLIMCNTLFPQNGTRRPPKSPRAPVVRLVRLHRNH